MANSVQKNTQMAAMAAAVVAGDAVLRQQLTGLVRDTISHMQYTMKTGTAADKLAIVKSITPQLLGALQSVEQDERKREEKNAIDRIYSMLRGEITPEQLAADLAS